MRVLREVLAVVLIVGLLAFPVWAQVIPGSPFGAGGSGGGVSFPLLAPDGTESAPSYSFSGHPTSGLLYSSTFLLLRGENGSGTDATGASTVIDGGKGTGTGPGGELFFRVAPAVAASSSSLNNIQDALIIRATTGGIALGALNIVTLPGGMNLWAANRATGITDGSAARVSIAGGRGTGTGDGGNVVVSIAPPAASTGSSQNATQDVVTISGMTGDINLAPALPGGGTRGAVSLGANSSNLKTDRTVTAGGTTGAQTINKMAGCVNFAAAATTLVVTNSLATATSIVLTTTHGNDGTCWVKDVERASGSFTIRMVAACTGETPVCFLLSN